MDEFKELGLKVLDKGAEASGFILGKALGTTIDAYIRIKELKANVERAKDLASTIAECGKVTIVAYHQLRTNPVFDHYSYSRLEALDRAFYAGAVLLKPVYDWKRISRSIKTLAREPLD